MYIPIHRYTKNPTYKFRLNCNLYINKVFVPKCELFVQNMFLDGKNVCIASIC